MTDKKHGHQPKYVIDATQLPNCGSGVMHLNTKRIAVTLGMPCIICGESVELTPSEVSSLEHGHHICSRVCDECKAAVARMKEQCNTNWPTVPVPFEVWKKLGYTDEESIMLAEASVVLK